MKIRIFDTVKNLKGKNFAVGSLSQPGAFVFEHPLKSQRTPLRGKGYYERMLGNPDADDHMLWLFRNRLVIVEPPIDLAWDEMVLAVKHAILSKERSFERMQPDIELFERLEASSGTPRESFSAAVRTLSGIGTAQVRTMRQQ